MFKKLFCRILAVEFIFLVLFFQVYSLRAKPLVIALDPGHGGIALGAVCTYNEKQVFEKDLNLEVAKKVEEILKNYETANNEKVKVILTHNGDFPDKLTLRSRIEKAKREDADVLISLHFNASDEHNYSGCLAIVTQSDYVAEDAKISDIRNFEENLAKCMLAKLKELGLIFSVDSGIMTRLSNDATVYGNGEITDWYGIISYGIEMGLPSIILEHAHLDSKEDYENFIKGDENMARLARADANALIEFFKLKPKKLNVV